MGSCHCIFSENDMQNFDFLEKASNADISTKKSSLEEVGPTLFDLLGKAAEIDISTKKISLQEARPFCSLAEKTLIDINSKKTPLLQLPELTDNESISSWKGL
jgi:hypothetical protein